MKSSVFFARVAACSLAFMSLGASASPPIESAPNGVYTLPTDVAQLSGHSVRLDEKASTLENWATGNDQANWKITNPKMGNYDVAVTWAVSDQDANQGYNIDIDHRSTIRAFTVPSGGGNHFKREVVGRIMLAPGEHDVTFFTSSNQVHGSLCKLKLIEIVPVEIMATSGPQKPIEFRLPSGFEIEQIAGPPLTSHPMLACLDDRGRLYVCESTGVNADGSVLQQSPPHEIRILEDTDGDGKFDKSTVFADKMTFPEGILWHDGAVYCSSPPNFWKLTDTNGDDVADEREVLATGFPFRGMSDDMHGGSLGRDGRIYFAVGRFEYHIRQPNGPVIRAGHNPVIVRCLPDGSELEVFSGSMGNAVGVDFSDAGDCFASGTFGVNENGKRDSLNHCIEGGAYPVLGQDVNEHKWTGAELPPLAEFGASASADLMMYRDDAFGPSYRGNLFSAQFNMHRIERHILEPDGASFRCQNEEFLISNDADFHPTDVLEDADGSMIVVHTGAWFLIGCPTSVIAKPQLAGGIYRIHRTDAKPVTDPRGLQIAWDKLEAQALIPFLDDSRYHVRDRAMSVLAARNGAALVALQGALNKNNAPRTRLNAVWTLARINDPTAVAAARLALTDEDVGVRQAAATSAGLSRDDQAVPQLIKMIAADKSQSVRREAANSLGRIGDRKAVPALFAALSGVSDPFLDHALILALIRLDDRSQTLAALGDRSPEVRRGALIALDQMDHGKLTQDDVTRALDGGNAHVQETALEVISRHSGWASEIRKLSTQWLAEKELSKDQQAELRGVLLAFIKDSSIQQMVAETLVDDRTPKWTTILLLDVVGQSELADLPHSWQHPLLIELQVGDVDIARAAVTAIAAVNQSLRPQDVIGRQELLAVARDDMRPSDVRVAAAAAALRHGEPMDTDEFNLLIKGCSPQAEPVTRLAAANAIGSARLDLHQQNSVVELLAAAGPLELPAILRAFENSDLEPTAKQLVQAIEKSPGLASIPSDRLVKLIDRLPPDARSSADALLERTHFDQSAQRKRLDELKDALNGGDPERGRSLFFGNKASCSACHRVGEEGGHIGPNLAGIGDIRTRRDLLEAVAFPSASFARNFEPYNVLDKSGITHSGIISRTTGDAIYLITTERETVRIPRSEIEEEGITPATVSIMPQGLDHLLQIDELGDLLAFLSSLREQKTATP